MIDSRPAADSVWLRLLPARVRELLETRPVLRRFAGNTGWMLAGRVARLAVGFAIGVWTARYLGPGPFGQLNFAIALVLLLSPLSTLGLERIVVRELVGHEPESGRILGSALALRLVGSLAAAALACVAVVVLRPSGDVARLLVPIVAFGPVLQSWDIIDYWYQSQVRARTVAIVALAGTLIAAAVRVALIVVHAPLAAFAWAWLIEIAAIEAGFVLAYLLRERGQPAWRWDAARARTLLRDGAPLMLSGVMVMIYLRIDQVMLGQMSTPDELGAYSAVVRLVEGWYFLPTVIVASVFPGIVEAQRADTRVFESRLQRLYALMSLIGYAVAIPSSLLAPWIIRLLYGPEFARAIPMLAVLVWSLPFTNLGVARGAFLTALNWNGTYLATVALGAAVNVALNLLLIPRMGGMGAVIASVVAYWLAAHGSCYLFPRMIRTGNQLTRALLRPWP